MTRFSFRILTTTHVRRNEPRPSYLELRSIFPGEHSGDSGRSHHFWGQVTGLDGLLIECGIFGFPAVL